MIKISLDKLRYTKAGVPLREVKIDEGVIDAHFGHLATFTVVSQSVAPGTTLLRGTTVDVTVAVTATLPLGIFPNLPAEWQQIPLQHLAEQVRADPVILGLLGKHGSAQTLSPTESRTVAVFMEKNGLSGGAEQVGAGFDAMRNAHLVASE